MSKKNNLLVAASGTGGHIFPALAVSKEVEDKWNIHWLGVSQRLDANFIPEKYNLRTLKIKTPKKNIFLFYQYIKILMSTLQIIRILKEKKIHLVFTTGGYIAAPTIVASKLLRIPVIIHESNVIPGMVTKNFGFFVPLEVNGIDGNVLDPRSTWAEVSEYDLQAKKLVNMFIDNFVKFESDVEEKILNSGPSQI